MPIPRRAVNAGLAGLLVGSATSPLRAAAKGARVTVISYGPLQAWCFVPAELDSARAPMVAVHGISRNAIEHLEAFSPYASQTGRMLIAPLFSQERFDGYQRLDQGTIRADDALIGLTAKLGWHYGLTHQQFDLFGFSGGAQFAHRFALHHPQLVDRLIVASAGWYTFPSKRRKYPNGLRTPDAADGVLVKNLSQFLRLPILTLVGIRDTKRDSSLRTGSRLDQEQGRHRLERAEQWVQALKGTADGLGINADVSLKLMAKCGHDFGRCVRKGKLIPWVTQWLAERDAASSGRIKSIA